MRLFLGCASVSLLAALTGCNSASTSSAPAGTLKTDDEKTIYAVGLAMHRQMAPFGFTAAEVEIVKKALSDATNGKPEVELETWGPKINDLAVKREGAAATGEKTKGAAYEAKAAAEAGAVKSSTGLIYKELKAGTGASPTAASMVKVHYKGTLINGTEFDSSYKRNEPAEFPLGGVIPCWTEGVQKMKVGGKAQLVCPSAIAYGDGGRPPQIPGGSTLVFEVELLEVKN